MTTKNGSQDQVTVTGSLVSRSNGVECPKIETQDGALIGLSYISPKIPVGTLLVVSGFYAIITECLGRVVVVQKANAI